MTIPEEQIPTAEVIYTIIGGRVVFEEDHKAQVTGGKR
jgi:hypothetical protein